MDDDLKCSDNFATVAKDTVARILVEKGICTAEEFNKVLEEETDKAIEVTKQTKIV